MSFEAILQRVEDGFVLDVLRHPNTERYPNQMIMVVQLESEVWAVPVVFDDEGGIFMKTAFPDRKLRKRYGHLMR